MILYHGSQVKELVPVAKYRALFNKRDEEAHARMRGLIYDLTRNRMERVFSDLIKEA